MQEQVELCMEADGTTTVNSREAQCRGSQAQSTFLEQPRSLPRAATAATTTTTAAAQTTAIVFFCSALRSIDTHLLATG